MSHLMPRSRRRVPGERASNTARGPSEYQPSLPSFGTIRMRDDRRRTHDGMAFQELPFLLVGPGIDEGCELEAHASRQSDVLVHGHHGSHERGWAHNTMEYVW